MTPSQAILAGAVLIAGSILFVKTIPSASAQFAQTGPFTVMHHSNPAANSSVFRMNNATGEISYCYVTPNTDLVCTRYAK